MLFFVTIKTVRASYTQLDQKNMINIMDPTL
jgi:hypothetical protein